MIHRKILKCIEMNTLATLNMILIYANSEKDIILTCKVLNIKVNLY